MIDKIFQSKAFKRTFLAVFIFIIILAIFKIGVIVGIKKAEFSYRWSDNYHKNFGGSQKGFIRGLGDRDFLEANGVSGQIIKIDGQNVVVKGKDNTEKTILVSSKTLINKFRSNIKVSDLKVDDFIIVIGEPNSAGQIEAKLIRVMPQVNRMMPQLNKS